jgi:Electron transfer flavoprotein, alpha subunit
VAEGLNWMGKDRYIGSSGARISPRLYFAIGISGQLQHMVGVTGAETSSRSTLTRTPRSSSRPTTAWSVTSTSSCRRSPPR